MRVAKGAAAVGFIILALAASCASPARGTANCPLAVSDLPGPAPMKLAAPILRWDEGLPLGNGLLGSLVWGGGNIVRFSLDRGDLWDLRTPEMLQRPDWNYATMQRLVAARDQNRLVEMYDAPYDQIPYPTKLPAGRIELTFPEHSASSAFELDLSRALASVKLDAGGVEAFVAADRSIIMIRVRGPRPSLALVTPAALRALGCAPAESGERGGYRYYLQKAPMDLTYAAVVGEKRESNISIFAISVASTADGADPLAIGVDRARAALDAGFDNIRIAHEAWWRDFWNISRVRVPDAAIQGQYDITKYYYGSASRTGAPPMPLQGVWTADDGNLPPWKGDYHNDLNTQMTYLAYHTAGLIDAGRAFVEFNYRLLPRFRQFAREFYQVSGAVVPGVMTLDGKPMGGWGQYSLSPVQGAWIAQTFYLHWKYTNDRRFLEERAWPFCEQIGVALESLLRPGADGRMHLPLSSSPEIFDNSMRAWLPPESNYDLALLRFIFSALAEMAEARGDASASRWSADLDRLGEFIVRDKTGSLAIARNLYFDESHRHFSHALAIYPLQILTIDGPRSAIVRATIDEIAAHGTDWWCGYSFSWMACMAASAGEGGRAIDYLQQFVRAFVGRNGFHLNGDQSGKGLSKFTYRPFTLEGNFLAEQAVHEMLIQSNGGVLRIFPAAPDAWPDAEFRDLRAEGGWTVSAARARGAARMITVRPNSTNRILRMRDPFAGRGHWNIPPKLNNGLLEFDIPQGEFLSGEAASADSGSR
ncbi:MAG: glycoside hydrolase N-terminal domain-containing protein [Planctomycetes bacterium]|nr:glycoside hydrolase N-terminal domain-containing protein [Planctomycetota bacterium]